MVLAIAGCGAAASTGAAPAPRPASGERTSPRRARTIAHDAIALEAKALPFAPSVEQTLDAVIAGASRRIRAAQPGSPGLDPRARAVQTLRLIAAELDSQHFVYPGRGYVATLHDALTPTLVDEAGRRRLVTRPENHARIRDIEASPRGPYHIADCDTFSILYVAIGEALQLPIAMVDLPPPPGGIGHNYVVWALPGGGSVAWEAMTGEPRDAAQLDRESFLHAPMTADQAVAARAFGVALTRGETLGYWQRIAADLWLQLGAQREALDALTAAIALGPRSPVAYNDAAWLLATSSDPRIRNPARAVQIARRAVALWPSANYIDTLAAANAAAGRWDDARGLQARAVAIAEAYDPRAASFRRRLAMYERCQIYLAPRRDEQLAESWRDDLRNPAWGDLAIGDGRSDAGAPIIEDACRPGSQVMSRQVDRPPAP